jgi:hypothetical protein
MIKHIVFWRLNESAYGKDKQANARLLKEKLLAMKNKVDGLLKIEVGFDFSNEKDSCDVVLYSEFESKEALHQYQIHPDHEEIKKWLSEVRYERRVVDYEVDESGV